MGRPIGSQPCPPRIADWELREAITWPFQEYLDIRPCSGTLLLPSPSTVEHISSSDGTPEITVVVEGARATFRRSTPTDYEVELSVDHPEHRRHTPAPLLQQTFDQFRQDELQELSAILERLRRAFSERLRHEGVGVQVGNTYSLDLNRQWQDTNNVTHITAMTTHSTISGTLNTPDAADFAVAEAALRSQMTAIQESAVKQIDTIRGEIRAQRGYDSVGLN